MSYADQVFIQTCQDILSKGVWDTDRPVRPRWEDGTPAHTIKLFGVVNRYDLRKEFPIITVRKQFLKSGRAVVDLAEEVQRRPSAQQPHLGCLGR